MADDSCVSETFTAKIAPFDVARAPIVGADSPFMRLPRGLEPKQRLYLDGIRHAAEVAGLAHTRLVAELTNIAVSHREIPPERMSFTAAFLDAWAIVDAVHRLRGLLHTLPGSKKLPRPDGKPSFRVQTEVIRDLRNVADHVAERAEYILARDGTAMGRLSWVTVLEGEPLRMLSCAMVPGTITKGTTNLINPMGQSFTDPSDLITLAAGGYTASLSEAMAEVRRVMGSLSDSLATMIRDAGHEGTQTGADLFAVALFEFSDE